MEPRIQYTRTPDGEPIAYWTLGDRPPFIHMGATTSHIQVEWDTRWIRTWYQRLARTRTVIRFDLPGMGLSQGGRHAPIVAGDFQEKIGVAIDCVADKLNEECFDLVAPHVSSPAGISYAGRQPGRVRRLVLFRWDEKAGLQGGMQVHCSQES